MVVPTPIKTTCVAKRNGFDDSMLTPKINLVPYVLMGNIS
jgi:hypothetical protein